MALRDRRATRGALQAQRICERLGRELRDARLRLGLSQADVGRAAGVSRAQVGRMERGEIRRPHLEQICRVALVLGFEPSVTLFPSGRPIRDRGHLALLERFEAVLGSGLRARREAPLPLPGDLRAWDLKVEGADRPFAAEGETHLYDAQDLARRIELKLRDDPTVGKVVLVVARSAHNRAVLAAHREALRDLLPLDGAAILRALRAGKAPPASGILVL